MTDKFIMIGLGDEKSSKIANILGNKTCKKIIDFLSEEKEASEKDIADALNIPINTAEYNLKKLIDAGLVEKTKNFFWSKRGKKIPMYKVAKKHIIISPKSKPTMNSLKTIIPIIIVLATALFIFNIIPTNPIDENQAELKKFNSYEELNDFLKENQEEDYYGGIFSTRVNIFPENSEVGIMEDSAGESFSKASDYSETNIQVEGVDEPDILKNDGKYIYFTSGNRVFIIDAYPAEDMEIISEINVSGLRNIFINKDKLIIFSNDYKGNQKTIVDIYDTKDKKNPEMEESFSVEGYYNNARMIGDYIYAIANKNIYQENPILPMIGIAGMEETVAVKEISYFPYPDTSYTFTNILAIDIENLDFESQTYLTGVSNNIYVSENNIYLTYTKNIRASDYFEEMVDEVFKPILPRELNNKINEIMDSDEQFYIKQREVGEVVGDYSMSLKGKEKQKFDKELQEGLEEFMNKLQKRTEKTIIHKIKVDELVIDYVTNGEVPGRILNQFSMDEYKDNFRITTTTGDFWSNSNSLNHLYVLNEELEIIGSVEDLAEGERIYSTRFIGERVYMVTFRQVDPLYVIDLSKPKSPEVLGYLKVTGYSNYLHPYDENHIIGIGKEASEEGRIQGVKIALFDVSDVENPIEKTKYEVEEKWSDSNALYDHKAFLFDKDRELLVLPMSYTEENEIDGYEKRYGYWQGAFVFNINENEIELKGKIDHEENNSEKGYYSGYYAVQRALYMDDTLYTISRNLIKANELENLYEISNVKLPNEERVYYGYAQGRVVSESDVMEVEVDF